MRKLIIAEFMSLDGVIQAPGGPEDDPSGVIITRYVRSGDVRTGSFDDA